MGWLIIRNDVSNVIAYRLSHTFVNTSAKNTPQNIPSGNIEKVLLVQACHNVRKVRRNKEKGQKSGKMGVFEKNSGNLI